MPTYQSLPSPTTNTTPSRDLSNGAAQDDRNGSTPISLPNGVQKNNDGDETRVADAIQAQKLKAKAQLSAPTQMSGSKELGNSPQTTNGDSKDSDSEPAVNGAVHSRKRSRSGNLISPPTQAILASRRRGMNDQDGKLFQKAKISEYLDRDLMHWSTIVEDATEHDDLAEWKREQKDHYLRLRAQKESEIAASWPYHPAVPPGRSPAKSRDDYIVASRSSRNLPPYGQTRDPAQLRALYGRNYPQAIPGRAERLEHQERPEKRISLLRKDLRKHAEQLDDLVPVRLDIEWEHADLGKIRLRDTLTWNLHERLVKPQSFAEILVEDFGLSLEKCKPLVDMVRTSIEEQIQDYYPHIFIDDGPADPQQPYDAYKDDELRITIKLNITIGQHTLVDQFEWDLNNSSEAAELFAIQMSQELSLSGEFTTAIAHSIREQCQLFTRSLYVLGHPFDGRPVTDEDLKSGLGFSPMPSSFRPYQAAKEFTPYFYELNDAELERTELSLSREERRQKRSVYRRGGPPLPDIKDRQRTIRTLVLSSVIPGAAESLEDSKIFKRAPAAKTKKSYARDGEEDSDDLESDESSDVIPSHLLSGTARTRGMRGAATVAQAAMRGAVGRSATPESTSHHHETRVSGRKIGGRDYREESADEAPTSLVVKFRFPKDRFKRFLQDMAKNKNKNLSADPPAHLTRRSLSATPGHGTPGPSSMAPPSTPGQQSQQQSNLSHESPGHLRDGQPINPLHPHAAQLGRVDASAPPTPENPAVSPASFPRLVFFHLLPKSETDTMVPASATFMAHSGSQSPPTILSERQI